MNREVQSAATGRTGADGNGPAFAGVFAAAEVYSLPSCEALFTTEHPRNVGLFTQLMFMAKDIDRIGDPAADIVEDPDDEARNWLFASSERKAMGRIRRLPLPAGSPEKAERQ